MMITALRRRNLAITSLLVVLGLGLAPAGYAADPKAAAAAAEAAAAIAERQSEIQALDKKIAELRSQQASSEQDEAIIAEQLHRLTTELSKARLELKRTAASIEVVESESGTTARDIEALSERVGGLKNNLRRLVRLLYDKETVPIITIWLTSGNLGQLLAERAAVANVQRESIALMNELRDQQSQLKERQAQLEQQQQDLDQLQTLLAAQQTDLRQQQDKQEVFLAAKQDEQLVFEQKLSEAQEARREIEQDIFTLKGAGISIALKDATDIARYASRLTGVRAALLLAVLKVESNVGANIGRGSFPDDMHPASREPFLRLTKKLGLDPHTSPISARPRSFSGWGGAMGPAQMMPQTWEGIELRVAGLMNKPTPNPYELTDAAVATAVLLVDYGAADPAREYEAVNHYIAGPNWRNFTWYGDRVLAVAREYEAQGL